MALSPTRTQPFASPKRKRDSPPYGSQNSPSKPRNAGSFRTYPLLLVQQAVNNNPPSRQTSVTADKFQNLTIRRNTIQNKHPPIQHDRKRLAATKLESSSSTDSFSLLNRFQLGSEVNKPEIQPPSASSFEFESPLTIVPDQKRRQSRSPPLDGEPQDNFWHDSEITGHNPADPDDDCYGINGIGFKPTPAIAWTRSQKRKQQLADYKSRETKEARQRRIERRRVHSRVEGEENEVCRSSTKALRVRFEDG